VVESETASRFFAEDPKHQSCQKIEIHGLRGYGSLWRMCMVFFSCFLKHRKNKKKPYTAALTFSLSLDLPYLTVRPMLDAAHKCAVCVKGILLERMKPSYVFTVMKMLTHIAWQTRLPCCRPITTLHSSRPRATCVTQYFWAKIISSNPPKR
jgi:hypothetical protein